jgi:hypothetical protein
LVTPIGSLLARSGMLGITSGTSRMASYLRNQVTNGD